MERNKCRPTRCRAHCMKGGIHSALFLYASNNGLVRNHESSDNEGVFHSLASLPYLFTLHRYLWQPNLANPARAWANLWQ